MLEMLLKSHRPEIYLRLGATFGGDRGNDHTEHPARKLKNFLDNSNTDKPSENKNENDNENEKPSAISGKPTAKGT